MSFDALHSSARVGPDLDLTIFTTSVAPALLVKCDTSEEGSGVFSSHNTRLLKSFSDISWVPEDYLFGCQRREAKVFGTLRPDDVENAVCGAICGEKVLLSLDVVYAYSVIVGEVSSGHITTTWGNGAGRNTTRTRLKSELANPLTCLSFPNMDSGRRS